MKLFIYLFIFLTGCEQVVLPKQKVFLSQQFPFPSYVDTQKKCLYNFQINELSHIYFDENCNSVIKYELLKSTIYISNIKINDNLELIKSDFNKRLSDNSHKSSIVKSSEFNDRNKNVYAKYFTFIGDSPSNTQFYITDSISNFISGSLFFESKPNYDSLLPSVTYMNNDIRKIIQSFKWN